MLTIKIVKTPNGEAPKRIRQAWVGIVLSCIGKFPSDRVVGLLSGKPVKRNQNVYRVEQKTALDALKKKAPVAANWYYKKGFPKPANRELFGFYEDEAKVLSP